MVYDLPGFELQHDADSGETVTRYLDGARSVTPVNPDDGYHADLLGLTPERHRLAHELMHHLLAIHRRLPGWQSRGCRIIWRSAHGEGQVQPEAGQDEWYITAATYYALGKEQRREGDWGALLDLSHQGVRLEALGSLFRWLLAAPDHPGAGVVLWRP